MKQSWLYLGLLHHYVALVICKSYYTIIAPGVIKSNHNYTAVVSLHNADEAATINLRIEGPFYFTSSEVYLLPEQTKTVTFQLPKIADSDHKLIAEGISGIAFRNESKIMALPSAGPKIYIQTDKAIYKPGDEVQFRVVILDEHTRPLRIQEPIRVEILDANDNRVKQFKDIPLVRGIYKNKFRLSEYPAIGGWEIKVTISGKFDSTMSKIIHVKRYVLPKFSVYIEAETNFVLEDGILKALVYGKYTFDKYVEGNITVRLVDRFTNNFLRQWKRNINTTATIEFVLNNRNRKALEDVYSVLLEVDLTEKHTGLTHSNLMVIRIQKQHYQIIVDTDSIQYRYNKPYRLKASVKHWNGTAVLDRQTEMSMWHGSNEYAAKLNDDGEAMFEFDHEPEANHEFQYKDSTQTLPNIYVPDILSTNPRMEYCKLTLRTVRPRLGKKMEIEVSSVTFIPYINYIIVGHATITDSVHIVVPPKSTSYIIEITPSIKMVPVSFIYVYFILNGQLRYDELKLQFPKEFENKVSVLAPTEVKPGANVTLELKAQPNSYVGLLAVDLGVYLLDASYDLQRYDIIKHLEEDLTYSPIDAIIYPGLLSGVLTLTNANYPFLPSQPRSKGEVGHPVIWKFRKKFPETWIFDNYHITNETTRLSLTVPDSITTWRITAFTVHDVTGFGIVDGPTDIIARQMFFIGLNLPYSVKRGEIVKIPVVVYNYHNQNLPTEITLHNQDNEFDFVESSLSESVKRINVPANGVENVEFLINPKQVGDLNLRITATNPISADAIIQQLKVEPEGLAKRQNKASYVSIRAGETFQSSFRPDIPDQIVPNSEYLTLSVGGDSLVPTLKNLNNLVLLPTGCGEQNMVNFAPNLLVLQYLKASGKYYKERSLVEQAKKFIEIGFQQQLAYRHKNGGFSVFGQRKDKVASTWLTAYVIRFFIKASKYLPIEAAILDSGMDFLAEQQFRDGDFPYTGYLFYPAQQNRFGFTAFLLMTFLEDPKYAKKYQITIQKGLSFINSNLNRINDLYALSIVATVLTMAKHDNARIALDKLGLNKRKMSEQVWWSTNDQNAEKDVEITAYTLMALLDSDNDPTEDQNILKWLLDQRNEKGGFKSTHDTVVGLQALVKYSEKYGQLRNMTLKIEYSAKNKENVLLEAKELKVDESNALVLQTQELPRSTRQVDVKITGSGYLLTQLSYLYHEMIDKKFNHFKIAPKPTMINPSELLLNICLSFDEPIISTDGRTDTNMIIMELNLPSGFTINDGFIDELRNTEIIQRIESKNSETTLVIYFEKLTATVEHCFDILTDKTNDVLKRKPAAIAVYDYYNISRYDTVFYNI